MQRLLGDLKSHLCEGNAEHRREDGNETVRLRAESSASTGASRGSSSSARCGCASWWVGGSRDTETSDAAGERSGDGRC